MNEVSYKARPYIPIHFVACEDIETNSKAATTFVIAECSIRVVK